MAEKRIYISVINDLATDQRVQRVAGTLAAAGYQPVLIGRRFRTTPELILRNIIVKRFRLWFNKGFLFYASYNFRLFFYLLFSRNACLFVSNDLDTLPANYLAAKIRSKKLVYDSHEYFTEVPELIGRRFVKRFWERIEKMLVPGVDFAYTVNETLSKLYSAKHGIPFFTIRNVPEQSDAIIDYKLPQELSSRQLILYQGAVNRDRGLEEMIGIIQKIPNTALVIAGDGDVLSHLKTKVANLGLQDRVIFTGRLCPSRLKSLTSKVQLGISLEKKTNLNYFYALPNKIFDYIQAGVPIVCSAFPEMRRIVEDFGVGVTVESHNPEVLAEVISAALSDSQKRTEWIENCKRASEVLNWKNEQKELIKLYTKAGLIFPEPN